MSKKTVGKVCDFELDYSSGVFTCCADEIMFSTDDAFEGMTLTCNQCGKEIVLRSKNGTFMWVGK